ncbi:MAG: pentapeptide repeat-containing protein [Bacteroidales bacterium]|nr:pentapeptide repeat-containing protein [Bacteroidales bacterium]
MRILTNVLILTAALYGGGCSANVASKSRSRDVQAADVIARLNRGEALYYDSCVIAGDLDFTTLRESGRIAANLVQVFVKPSVTFNKCVFTGKVVASKPAAGRSVCFLRNLTFTGCDFRGDVEFAEIDVTGNVFFTGAVFRRRADFQGAFFRHRKAYFNEVKFEGDALFQNAVFSGDANFMHTEFGATANFQKARVGALAMFGNARFSGYADFSYVRAAESIFNYAQFAGRRDFSESNITVK